MTMMTTFEFMLMTMTTLQIPHHGDPMQSPVVPLGQVVERKMTGDPKQKYYLYVPKRGGRHAPILVTVHGISRNARAHARQFSALADKYNAVIVAPKFNKERYPTYQRLGLSGERADLALQRIVAEVSALTGANLQQLYLFGYSGGGQFVHRYAMAYPHQVTAIAIGAAGWYTLPDANRRYPYGIAPNEKLPDLHFDASQFLRIPACVLVGDEDVERDPALRVSAKLDAQQGISRLERGQRWIEAMREAADRHGLDTPYQFITLPNAGHSFSRSVRHGGMVEHALTWLFDTTASKIKQRHDEQIILEVNTTPSPGQTIKSTQEDVDKATLGHSPFRATRQVTGFAPLRN